RRGSLGSPDGSSFLPRVEPAPLRGAALGEPSPVVFAPPRVSRRLRHVLRRSTTGYSPLRLRRGPPPRFHASTASGTCAPPGAGASGEPGPVVRAAACLASTPASPEALDHRLFSSTPSAWPAAAFPRFYREWNLRPSEGAGGPRLGAGWPSRGWCGGRGGGAAAV